MAAGTSCAGAGKRKRVAVGSGEEMQVAAGQ